MPRRGVAVGAVFTTDRRGCPRFRMHRVCHIGASVLRVHLENVACVWVTPFCLGNTGCSTLHVQWEKPFLSHVLFGKNSVDTNCYFPFRIPFATHPLISYHLISRLFCVPRWLQSIPASIPPALTTNAIGLDLESCESPPIIYACLTTTM